MMQALGGMGGGGGIISSALQLIKEKERQADKAMGRLHDGMKTQMEVSAGQGSWTGNNSSAPQKIVKEKVIEKEEVKDTDDEPEEKDAPQPPGPDKEEPAGDKVADMGIIDLAKGASE